MERAERKLDSSRSNQDSSYFELVESGNEDNEYENIDEDGDVLVESPRTSMLDYTSSKCAKRQVVHVQCRDLECGVRPQLVSTRARYIGGQPCKNVHWPLFIIVSMYNLLQRHFFAILIFEKDRGWSEFNTGCMALASGSL